MAVMESAHGKAVFVASEEAETHRHDSVKDTIESIVVALILAFVFRAFIVEAFVIPTGSMAPTLYGAHGTIVCNDCGWEFAYGLQDPSSPRRSELVTTHLLVSPTSQAVCPNCNHANSNLSLTDTTRNAEAGDRILVLKWPYDLGTDFLGPKRWDVAVFKNPSDGEENYIKRLVGLPNEVLMIVDGDVYTVPTAQLSQATLDELDHLRHEKYLFHTRQKQGRMPTASPAVLDALDRKMTIARKTPAAQRSLWFVVYDHDHLPRNLDNDQPRWRAARSTASGWDTSSRVVRFESREAGADYIELDRKPIVAAYAYNLIPSLTSDRQPSPVGDQRVRFVLTPRAAEGALHVRLVKGGRSFCVTLEMGGRVALAESADVPPVSTASMAEERLSPFVPDRSVDIRFENVDYRLALFVDGREVLATSDDPNSRAYFGPHLKSLRAAAPKTAGPRIYAEGTKLELSHLAVERDIYYYNTSGPQGWDVFGGWGTTGNPILLRAGEYFMLGDNSPASQDSRHWGDISKNRYLTDRGEDYQLGTVPHDQLIGKAFFVYWPSAYRLKWLPLPKGWGIVPDVGRMRWIR